MVAVATEREVGSVKGRSFYTKLKRNTIHRNDFQAGLVFKIHLQPGC